MTFSMSRLIHKNWWPPEDIEARLKICMLPCIVQKYKLNLRTQNHFGTA